MQRRHELELKKKRKLLRRKARRMQLLRSRRPDRRKLMLRKLPVPT